MLRWLVVIDVPFVINASTMVSASRHPSHAQRLIGGRDRLLMPLGQHLGPGELGVCPGQLGDLTERLGLLQGGPQGRGGLDPPRWKPIRSRAISVAARSRPASSPASR